MKETKFILLKVILLFITFNMLTLVANAQLSILKEGGWARTPKSIKTWGNKTFFSFSKNYRGDYNDAFWVTDGTDAGTIQLANIYAINNSFVELGNKLYFRGRSGNELGLWVTDGTRAGTRQVYKFAGKVSYLLKCNDQLFFVEYTQPATGLMQLKRLNIAQNKVEVVSDINLVNAYLPVDSYQFMYPAVLGNKMYFLFRTTNDSEELWRSDGTALGTSLFKRDLGMVEFRFFASNNYLIFNLLEGDKYYNLKLDVVTGNTKKIGRTNLNYVTEFTWKNQAHFLTTGSKGQYHYYDSVNDTILPSPDFDVGLKFEQVLEWKGDHYFSYVHKSNDKEYAVLEKRNENSGTIDTLVIETSDDPIEDFIPVNDVLYGVKEFGGVWRTNGSLAGTVQVLPYNNTKLFALQGQAYLFLNLLDTKGVNLYRLEAKPIPVIQRFSPSQGCVGDTIIIQGLNFTSDTQHIQVQFEVTSDGPQITKTASVVSATATEIKALVPPVHGITRIRLRVFNVLTVSDGSFIIQPKITGFNPTHGEPGDRVTIYGSGFVLFRHLFQSWYESHDFNVVKLNGVAVEITRAYGDSIKVKIPANASTGRFTVDITTNGQSTTSTNDFIIGSAPPTPGISLSPSFGVAGDIVTINAVNFSFNPVTNSNIVKFNGIVATVSSASTRQLKVIVPEQATQGKVSVTVNGTTMTSAEDFTVGTAPASISFSPSSGIAGDLVVINAVNFSFSPVANENIVKFNGITAPVSSASTDQLVVLAPSRVTTGKVSVTVAGNTMTSAEDFVVTITGLPQTLSQGKLTLYPNPVAGILRLQLEGTAASELQVTVFDTRGQQVMQQALVLQNGLASLNLEGLSSGKYILKIQVGTEILSRGILKK